MYIVETYSLAVLFTVITMLCWGSWANTQKLAGKSWRFELFYWDYVLGIVLLAIIGGGTLGSLGSTGRSFLSDLNQADTINVLKALAGGAVFNAANILLVMAIAVAGMSVAFPVGIGLALVLGVVVNYMAAPQGNAGILFVGVAFIVLAMILDALAHARRSENKSGTSAKGIVISLLAGGLMAFFYRFVAASMVTDFNLPEAGKMGPYAAVFVFSLGIFLSNLVLNPLIMRFPVEGSPVTLKQYFAGRLPNHFWGVIGGVVWCTGMLINIVASGKAGFAISYGLGQGATLIAALWGLLVWKEFKGADAKTNQLVWLMLLAYVAGLVCIVVAGM